MLAAAFWMLLAVAVQAANVRWIGAADDVAQVTTSTVTGAWATDDTAVAQINNKQVVLALGTDVATTDVAAELAAAINATDAETGKVGVTFDETRNVGGQDIGEFNDVIATASGSVLTITSRTPGVPYTIAFSATTAGSGAMGAASTTTAATGRNNFDNAANWEGGSLPSATDTLVFDAGSVSVLFGLENTTLDYAINRANSYTGSIGLPKINNTHAGRSYSEYRARFLAVPVTATTGSVSHYIGDRTTTRASGATYLDFGTNDPASIYVYCNATAAAGSDGAPLQVVGGKDLYLTMYGGNIDAGTNLGENATTMQVLTIFKADSAAKNSVARVGTNANFFNGILPIRQYAGTIYLDADCDGTNNAIEVHGGTLLVAQTSQLRALRIYGGRVDFRGTLVNALSVYGGEFDATRCLSATISNSIMLYSGFTYRDPGNVIGQTIEFQGCKITDGVLALRKNITITIGTPSSSAAI